MLGRVLSLAVASVDNMPFPNIDAMHHRHMTLQMEIAHKLGFALVAFVPLNTYSMHTSAVCFQMLLTFESGSAFPACVPLNADLMHIRHVTLERQQVGEMLGAQLAVETRFGPLAVTVAQKAVNTDLVLLF